MVDVILVMMLLVAGLSLGEGDAEATAGPQRDSAAAIAADHAEGSTASKPCGTPSPLYRDLGTFDRLPEPDELQDQGDPDGR
jgi:hypothetical protein